MITFIVLLFLALVLGVCLSISNHKAKRDQEEETFKQEDEEFHGLQYNKKSSAQSSSFYCYIHTYTESEFGSSPSYPQRILFGTPVTTQKQLTEWYVYKGFIEGMEETVSEMAEHLKDGSYPVTQEYVDKLKKYISRHDRIRDACNIYVCKLPLNEKGVDALYERWKAMNAEHMKHLEYLETVRKESAKYLSSRPDKTCPRSVFIPSMAGILGVTQEEMKQLYKELINAKCLRQYQIPPSKRYIVKSYRKKLPYLKPDEPAIPRPLPPSVYSPSLYANVDYRTVAKARITVSAPDELDRENNTCIFRSQSRNDIYRTSLSKCTCLAYDNGYRPCKHMVALASTLGYFKPSSVPEP